MTRFLALSLLLLSLATNVSVAFAEKCPCPPSSSQSESANFLALHAPSVALSTQIQPNDSALVASYIDEQLRINQITMDTFKALPVAQQRKALSPGKHLFLSRQDLHAIVPKRDAIPYDVRKNIVVNRTLDDSTITRYGVSLPETLSMSMGKTPEGFSRLLIGNQLVMMDSTNTITDVAKLK
ncbi:MAG: hypothetical protein VKK59_01480 [Vampirovibrionales bacterium]|nr:hypothetical protein [Vampirovibrionales bacterium]